MDSVVGPKEDYPRTVAGMVHGLVGWPMFFALSVLIAMIGTVTQLLVLPFDRHRRMALWAGQIGWGKVVWFLIPPWSRTLQGTENLGPGPYILVANHISLVDIPLVMGLGVPMRLVAKAFLFRLPVMGAYLRLARHVRVDHGSTDAATQMFSQCKRALDAGISLLIFPEGTRSPDGELMRFNRGAFRLAKDLNVPVVPLVIAGTRSILRKADPIPRDLRGHCTLRVLEPIDPGECSTARKLSNRVHTAISDELGTMAREGIEL